MASSRVKSRQTERGEPIEAVCERLGVDIGRGLESGEARRRLRRDGPGRIFEEERSSALRYAGLCSSDLLLVLLLLTSVTAAAFGIRTAYRVIIPILAVSIILRTVAYIAARRRLEALSSAELVMPSSAVLRDGKTMRVDARTVVRGDIVRLASGDIAPADCRIISAVNLDVYEESITGISGAVRKSAKAASGGGVSRADTVYAGSVVIGGVATAVAVECGADTLAVRTRGYFKTTRQGTMKLTRLLEKYSRVWGAAMTVVAFAVTVIDIFFGQRELYDVFFMGLSLAVASMCEYYSAIGDIVSAIGLYALGSRSGVAVRGVRSIETLSGLDVIITGADGVVVTDGMECQAYFFDGKPGTGDAPDELLRYAALTVPESADALSGEAVSVLAEYTGRRDAFELCRGAERPILSGGIADGLKFDTRLLDVGGAFMSVSAGDAGSILESCSYIYADGAERSLPKSAKDVVSSMIAHHERRGAVCVAVARKTTPFHSIEKLPFAQAEMTLFGIVFLYRPLAPELTRTVSELKRAGIRIVLTGRGGESAKLADRAGIISGRQDVLSERDFLQMNEEARADAVLNARLLVGFGTRSLSMFAETLRKGGKNVAYVATLERGMKDELSMLGCVGAGFALSGDGGEARGVSQAVKLRADNIIPRADENGGGMKALAASVAYSKRIYRNILNIANYLLTSQAARIFSVLYTVLFHKSALVAEQILLWGLIFDFLAVLVLARERPDEGSLSDSPDVYERLSHPLSRLGVTVSYGVLWAALTMLAPNAYIGGGEYGASVIFISVLLSLFVVCAEHRQPYPVFSRRRTFSTPSFVFACAISGMIMAITMSPAVAGALELTPPSPPALLVSLIPAAGLLIAYELPRLMPWNNKNKAKSLSSEETENG